MSDAGGSVRASYQLPSLTSWGRSKHAGLGLVLIGSALVTGYFMAMRLHFLTDFSEASYSSYFWEKRYGLIVHIWAGLLAIICGFVQVWMGINGRTGAIHRRLGWTYVACVGISSASAIHLALMVPGHFTYASGLFMNAIIWAAATAMGLWARMRGRMQLHREWMLRSYVLALAFTAARIMLPLFRHYVEVPSDPLADDIQGTVAWACWVIPLLMFDMGRSWSALRR